MRFGYAHARDFEKMAATSGTRQQQRLRRVLSRFRKEELPSAIRWLGRSEEVSKRRSKRDIISSTLEAFAVSCVCKASHLLVIDVYVCPLQESKSSEHAITELELQCKLACSLPFYNSVYSSVYMVGAYGRCIILHVYTSFFAHIDVLTHPNSLQWKAYSLKYANGKFTIHTMYNTHTHTHTQAFSLSLSLLLVWMPSMANTDPQMFCKRFQLYLGDMDYVSAI